MLSSWTKGQPSFMLFINARESSVFRVIRLTLFDGSLFRPSSHDEASVAT